MNIQTRPTIAVAGASKLAIADCDLHLGPDTLADLYPFMESRWARHIESFGVSHRTGKQFGAATYPKAQAAAMRRDAWPPSGKFPGSDLGFVQAQHLDAYNVQFGVINPPLASQSPMNQDLANALARAMNEFQVECLVKPEPRLGASITVNSEDTLASVAEIERCAGNRAFTHVGLLSRIAEPMGSRRYFPIFEAAVRAGLPVAVHAFGFGGIKNTAAGWASYYIEDMVGHAQSMQGQLVSLVMEGVFARLPGLKLVLIEGGFGWAPSLCWRLDKIWEKLRAETPHVPRPPSEYIRAQVWFTTQPMEEPENRQHVLDAIDWIGWDRLLFASDYPHWDFDDPFTSVPRMTEAQKAAFYRGNARAVFGR